MKLTRKSLPAKSHRRTQNALLSGCDPHGIKLVRHAQEVYPTYPSDATIFAMKSPAEIDAKSLALHHLVVQKILADRSLFEKIQENLDRYQAKADGSVRVYLTEWQSIVDLGIDAALAVALEQTERGQVLRSTSPFSGILTELERMSFLSTWTAKQPVSTDAST